MVPEGADAMRHVKHGNLEKLKASIASGEATLWDTTLDGWSLLHVQSNQPSLGSILTKLKMATYNRHLPVVKYLLEAGVDTEAGEVGSR
jgi:ankyrin repeat protein